MKHTLPYRLRHIMLLRKINFFLLCALSLISTSLKSAAHNPYILITDIGGDIDDALTVAIALNIKRPPEAIIATHHKPFEKAQIAKLIAIHSGFPNIPVYVGSGCTEHDSRETFTSQNSLWPSFFGYLNPAADERLWNATQAKAYCEVFEKEFDDSAKQVIIGSAHHLLIAKSKQCKDEEKIDIVALGPLHDIYNALKIINEEEGPEAEAIMAKKLNVWSMGGDYPQGYNWLISPETTNYVVKRVSTICISSSLIRDNKLTILPCKFADLAEIPNKTPLAQAIFQDWLNWNKDDQLKNEKNLCDLATLYLYLYPEEIEEMQPMHIAFPCLTDENTLKKELVGKAYCAPGLEGRIITIEPTAHSTVQFVQKIKNASEIRNQLVRLIAQIFSSF